MGKPGRVLLPLNVLRERGRGLTGIFGKWSLGDISSHKNASEGVPTRQGFDEFFGYLDQIHAHFYYPWFLWKNETRHRIPENEGERHARYSHDLIVEDDQGALSMYKASTTPGDPIRGVLDALELAAADRDATLPEFLAGASTFLHGTTHALNAVVTGSTAKTALLTTLAVLLPCEPMVGVEPTTC